MHAHTLHRRGWLQTRMGGTAEMPGPRVALEVDTREVLVRILKGGLDLGFK
jgi:hypothetical protein